MIDSVFPVLCVSDVSSSREFYVSLFGFKVVFDSDWYVQLHSSDEPRVQLGLIDRAHESIDETQRSGPRGFYVSIEVPNVDEVHARAAYLGLSIEREIRDESFGQRHFVTSDPDGALVDVITPIEFAPEHLSSVRGAEGA